MYSWVPSQAHIAYNGIREHHANLDGNQLHEQQMTNNVQHTLHQLINHKVSLRVGVIKLATHTLDNKSTNVGWSQSF